jgi:hypothetical protein
VGEKSEAIIICELFGVNNNNKYQQQLMEDER